jgi:NAD(P)-dependent dehydrogenase (short-subunit alcohol dehydrogenase family)
MSKLFEVSDKVVFISGAGSGLGNRVAYALMSAGAKVVGVDINTEGLDELKNKFGSNFAAIKHDLSDRDGLAILVNKSIEPYGAPDILIHAAGVNLRQDADEVTQEGWDMTMDINVRAPFFLSKLFVPFMKEKGWGRIINFASLQSFRAFTGGLAYGCSKGAVAQMTRAMAQSWSKFGINANAIGPGFFQTNLTKAVFADKERADINASQTCIGRNGELSDLDGPILFLSSRASDYITGQIIMLDGGFTAK